MGFKAGAQGINTKGKTKGTNLGDDGASIGVEKGPAKKTVGKKNVDMKTMGRGLAKVKAQKGR
jgi:hypothetical protein